MTTITILAFGTQGDVGPVTGLATGLAAAGIDVAVAAQAPYRNFIESAGLEYRFLPKDTEVETRRSASAQALINGGRMKPSRSAVTDMVDQMRGVGPAMIDACNGADLIIAASPVSSLFGYHIAQGLGVPSFAAFLQPLAPTSEFPPPPLGTKSLGRAYNRMLWKLGALADKPYLPQINEVRAAVGLTSTTLAFQRERNSSWPIMHGFSEVVVPRPADWRPGIDITGYWWPPMAPEWQPSADLEDFLSSGPPPVFVGLGSTATNLGEQISETISSALKIAGARAIVQSGWARLHATGDEVITVGEVPHAWLFPRCAVAVHHCGAGTTAAGLRAGIPAVAVPGIMDQPFWAKRLHVLGVAPEPLPRAKLTPELLAARITEALSGGYTDRALEISHQLRAEDGVENAIRIIEKALVKTV